MIRQSLFRTFPSVFSFRPSPALHCTVFVFVSVKREVDALHTYGLRMRRGGGGGGVLGGGGGG